MSEPTSAQDHFKIKCKKNVQSYRLMRKPEQFPKDCCLTIAAQDLPIEASVLEIWGESDAPIPSSLATLEWIGTFPRIKKVLISDVQISAFNLSQGLKNFLALENVALKNVSFQNMSLENFLQTLPLQLKTLSLIHSGPFDHKIKFPTKLLLNLEQLDLSKNKLRELPDWVRSLSKLKRLTLDSNQLQSLPLYLKNLSKLNHLSVDNNPFSQEAKEQIQRDFKLWF